jgi:hypothetical protein
MVAERENFVNRGLKSSRIAGNLTASEFTARGSWFAH